MALAGTLLSSFPLLGEVPTPRGGGRISLPVPTPPDASSWAWEAFHGAPEPALCARPCQPGPSLWTSPRTDSSRPCRSGSSSGPTCPAVRRQQPRGAAALARRVPTRNPAPPASCSLPPPPQSSHQSPGGPNLTRALSLLCLHKVTGTTESLQVLPASTGFMSLTGIVTSVFLDSRHSLLCPTPAPASWSPTD